MDKSTIAASLKGSYSGWGVTAGGGVDFNMGSSKEKSDSNLDINVKYEGMNENVFL